MPEPLVVDPFYLELAGTTLQDQVLPVPPPPIAAEGSDAASEAINVTMPIIEAPVNQGLPAAQASAKATGSKLTAAARMYTETDQKLSKKLQANAQFNGTADNSHASGVQNGLASPLPGSPHPPVSEFYAQPSSVLPEPSEDSPPLMAAGASGPGPSAWDVADNELSASLNPDAPDELFNSTAWTDPGDPDMPEAGVRPESWEGADGADFPDGDEGRPDLDSWGDAQNPTGQDAFADQDGSSESSTNQQASDNEQFLQGQQSSADLAAAPGEGTPSEAVQPASAAQPGTPGQAADPRQAGEPGTGARTSDSLTRSGDPKSLGESTTRSSPLRAQSPGASLKGRVPFSQPGGAASGRGVPHSLTGLSKPPIPHMPGAGHESHGHQPPVTPASASGQPLPLTPEAPGGKHAAPLSASIPPGPSAQPPAPHLSPPAASQIPSAPAPQIPSAPTPHSSPSAPPSSPPPMPPSGGGADGGAAPPPGGSGSPGGASRPVTPSAAKDGGAPDGDAGQKPSGKSPTAPTPAGSKDGATAGTPVSAARAERDAIANATAADAARRKGPDPLQMARRIAAALNAPDTLPERHFGFYWVTGLTTSGQIVVANSYGIAYVPDCVQLPELVRMASADDAIPLTDRARWITYPIVAVKGWADHRDDPLRAVIATAEQFGQFDPGVTKVVLEPDDIPKTGKMIGRSRLAVVDPKAAERLEFTRDEKLVDLLPPAEAQPDLTNEEHDMLWVEVTTPLLDGHPNRQGAHLRAFMIYSAEAELAALRDAHRSTASHAKRKAVGDWLYWKRIANLLEALLQEAKAGVNPR
jgi:hypothetical protein